ncbi:MAG: ferrous iron transport protein B [Clostridiales bacterium]|nr:ferrous iron transport protein B [Clostridiales bacterium]
MEYNVALVGNPNVGKTSLYNRITHSLEHVGNWHGVTVTEVSKKIMFDHHTVNMVDLPGLYSLTIYSPEEGISRDHILQKANDLIINVCEVNNLARNLYLTLQLLELDVPVVLVINMMDELQKQGKVLNYRNIEKVLKVPIVPMSAKYHSDVHLLMDVSLDYIASHGNNTVALDYLDKLPVKEVSAIIGQNAASAKLPLRYAAIKVLENDAFVCEQLALTPEQKEALASFGDMQARVAQARYAFIDRITEGAVSRSVTDEHHEMHEHMMHNVPVEEETHQGYESDDRLKTPADKKSKDKHFRHHEKHKKNEELSLHGFSPIDRIVLNKYLALPIFLLVMALIFIVTFGLLGKFFTWLLELGIDKLLYTPISNALTKASCPAWIVGLLCDGIINGVGGILVFLPQIVLLFFFLALLEDSGYISRVAFMTDGFFRKIGLSGRSAFTMLMGFGCSATAVLTARGLEDPVMRKKTVLLTPFMSCSARLPVYSTIAAAFFAKGSPFIIFGMYILGAAVALLLAAIFEKCIKPLKSGKLSFIMEMPPYRFPTAERVLQLIWHNTKVFLIRVGTTVFALNVIVWLLSNFSFTAGYTVGKDAKSILELFSGFIAPVFKPLGFGNWKAVTSLMSGLVAKEVVISSIDSFGGVAAVFTGAHPSLSALAFMVFTLLYVPCVATLVAIKKECGIKWMFFSLLLQIGVAYVAALVFYGIGLLFYLHKGLVIGILLAAAVAAVCIAVLVAKIRGKGKCPYCSGGSCGSCHKDFKDKQ